RSAGRCARRDHDGQDRQGQVRGQHRGPDPAEQTQVGHTAPCTAALSGYTRAGPFVRSRGTHEAVAVCRPEGLRALRRADRTTTPGGSMSRIISNPQWATQAEMVKSYDEYATKSRKARHKARRNRIVGYAVAIVVGLGIGTTIAAAQEADAASRVQINRFIRANGGI